MLADFGVEGRLGGGVGEAGLKVLKRQNNGHRPNASWWQATAKADL